MNSHRDITDRFKWTAFDVRTLLPADWADRLLRVSRLAVQKVLRPRSVTSREASTDLRIPVLTVSGTVVRSEASWLYELYRGLFRDFGQTCVDEPLAPAENDLYGVTLNVQRGDEMRYEAHVDSNPLEGRRQ